jgi:hypothetical protein
LPRRVRNPLLKVSPYWSENPAFSGKKPSALVCRRHTNKYVGSEEGCLSARWPFLVGQVAIFGGSLTLELPLLLLLVGEKTEFDGPDDGMGTI